MAFAPRVVLLACLPLLASCVPSLWESRVSDRSFVSPVPCAQGPFELHTTTLRSLWGQVLRVSVSGPPTVHVEIWIDGAKVEGRKIAGLGTSTACQLDASQRGAGPLAGGAVVPSTGTAAPGGDSATLGRTSAPVLVEVPVTRGEASSSAPMHSAVAEPAEEIKPDVVWEDVTVATWEDIAHVYPAGRDVKILVWADSLQDFRASKIYVYQAVQRPSGTDAEYLAYLRQDYDKRQAEAHKSEAERAQFEQDCVARVAKNEVDSKCRDKGYRNASEGEACEALAAKNAVTRECREAGYINASVKAEAARCASLRVFDSACCAGGYVCWRPYAPAASPASVAIASRNPSAPPGPPPLPQVEVQPPQPSVHAEWIPGSWIWDGFRWQWLSGGWRVPDSDIAAKATATAPTLPPPPQAEPIPPRPGSGVAWAPGYWHWSGGRWIWVGGRWAVPPSAGLTWHSSVWFVDGGTVRLDPGRWVAR
jgi:hypothetical protein